MTSDWDEAGLVRAISVKARSSLQRKELFKAIQIETGVHALQLLLDMKVRWGSTYVMLTRAESRHQVCLIIDCSWLLQVEVNDRNYRKSTSLSISSV